MKSIKELYDKYYYIDPLDYANLAESNRLANIFWSRIMTFVMLVNAFVILILYHNNLREHVIPLIFVLICALDCFCSCVISTCAKPSSRSKKANFIKNFPIYMIFCWGSGGCSYILYLLKDPFTACASFVCALAIMLSVFSLSIPVFFVISISGFCALVPGIHKNFGAMGLLNYSMIVVLFLYISFYKKTLEKRYIALLKKQRLNLEIKTFGNFTPLYNQTAIKFSKPKSLELLAYLIYKNGSSVNTKELISVLYGDVENSASYGASVFILISDIKRAFNELDVQNFFITEYNSFRINPQVVKCDYYDFLAGDSEAIKSFKGKFMSQFTWAQSAVAMLESKARAI